MSSVANRSGPAGQRWMWWVPASLWLFLPLAVWTLGLQAAEPEVTNVRAGQRPGTILIDITYDVANADGNNLRVSVEVSVDGGKTYGEPAGVLSGDVGPGITPGVGKRVVWEAGVEWLGRTASNLVFRVTARSGTPIPGMVWIAPGSFVMGSPPGERERSDIEEPQTRVRLTKGFWLGKHEVTQSEWTEVMGSNPSSFKGASDLPVERVSWAEAMAYCRKVTERERGAGRLPKGYEYRLPTEAQWEYACRAGTTSATAFGESLSSTQANFDGRYPYGEGAKGPYLERTVKVGSYAPNAWGLSDMHGNVWEWCLDWYGPHAGGSVTDPQGSPAGAGRVIRGGSWDYFASVCRSAYRYYRHPTSGSHDLGFRVVLAPGQP